MEQRPGRGGGRHPPLPGRRCEHAHRRIRVRHRREQRAIRAVRHDDGGGRSHPARLRGSRWRPHGQRPHRPRQPFRADLRRRHWRERGRHRQQPRQRGRERRRRLRHRRDGGPVLARHHGRHQPAAASAAADSDDCGHARANPESHACPNANDRPRSNSLAQPGTDARACSDSDSDSGRPESGRAGFPGPRCARAFPCGRARSNRDPDPDARRARPDHARIPRSRDARSRGGRHAHPYAASNPDARSCACACAYPHSHPNERVHACA